MNRRKRQIGKVVPIHARDYVVSDQSYTPAALPWERSLTYSEYRYRSTIKQSKACFTVYLELRIFGNGG